MASAFTARFARELRSLTLNSGPIIGSLTMLAADGAGPASGAVVDAVARHCRTCPPPARLYTLYLVDSIVKNVGHPYTVLFAARLPELFLAAYDGHPPSRPALDRLLAVWEGAGGAAWPPGTAAAVRAAVGGRGGGGGHLPPPPPLPPPPHHAAAAAAAAPFFRSGGGGPPPAPAPPPAAVPDFLASLAAAGVIKPAGPAATAPAAAAGQPPRPPSRTPPREASPPPSTVGPPWPPGDADRVCLAGTRLDTGRAATATAVAALAAASAASRPARLDAAFLRRRRKDEREAMALAADGPPPTQSRAWFVDADAWIRGTSGGGGGGRGGDDGGPAAASAAAPPAPPSLADLPTAPADDGQRSCALTGEPFASFWDEARGEWRYRDCIALSADAASGLGLPAGRLVKASALGPPGGNGGGGGVLAGAAADAALAADLAAAVAGDNGDAAAAAAAPATRASKRVKVEPK